jgi:hypothetical protein
MNFNTSEYVQNTMGFYGLCGCDAYYAWDNDVTHYKWWYAVIEGYI